MTMTGDPATCSVCGQLEVDPRNVQQCFNCGNDFHLNPRNDVPGIDCGDAWIGESLGLEYYCQVCIDRLQAESMQGAPDATTARHAEMMQAIAPSYPGAPSAPTLATPTPARRGEPPPKRERTRVRRRYRRIDS
ncbi:MAG: hypothetical protein IT299_05105 [Dehalococcoidia bacterium]|nr:hypothetical protein [Dehalococcoidia bacterium]